MNLFIIWTIIFFRETNMYLVQIPLVLFNPETNVSHDHNLDGRSYFGMYSAYANMLSWIYLAL